MSHHDEHEKKPTGRTDSDHSDNSTSSSNDVTGANLSMFSGLDGVFSNTSFPFCSFINGNSSSSYSPVPIVKAMENCRLSAIGQHSPKRGPTYSTSLEFREVVDRLPDFPIPEESFAEFAANNTSFVGNFQSNVRSTRLLPTWAVDLNGNIRDDLSLQDVLNNGSLIDFAMDRTGVKFLERNYPEDADNEMHQSLFNKLTEHTSTFIGLCRSAAGNFIIQKFVEYASLKEQAKLVEKMTESGLTEMSLDKFACRVVQVAIQKFDVEMASKLVAEVGKLDLMPLCTDQCAIHVIQKVVKLMPISTWSFFVKFLCRDDNLMSVCQDKYGCRLVQQTIDKLSDNPKSPCFNTRLQLLHGLMTSVARNCFRLASNEFANYVVQYVIKSSGIMEMYRDTIIEKCLLRNLLSMSQDKYASHVVEGAFLFAPPKLLTEMMDEIFDGYVKDQESNRDALDILLFHQYGNYVVQQMISICISALLGKEERKLCPSEMLKYNKWFEKIKGRVSRHSARLERFSSGKKIIESIQKMTMESPMTMFTSPMGMLSSPMGMLSSPMGMLPSPLTGGEPYPLWAMPPTPLMDFSAQFFNRPIQHRQHHPSVFDDYLEKH